MVMAYVDFKYSYCIVVVVVNEVLLKKFVLSKGIIGDVDMLCVNFMIIKEILFVCKLVCKIGKFVGFETSTTYILIVESWISDNDLVIVVFKLK